MMNSCFKQVQDAVEWIHLIAANTSGYGNIAVSYILHLMLTRH